MLEDRSVSRRHAVITCRGGEVMLLDDRSLNGVHVNGERVAQARLRDGDAIAVGDVQMRFLIVGYWYGLPHLRGALESTGGHRRAPFRGPPPSAVSGQRDPRPTGDRP